MLLLQRFWAQTQKLYKAAAENTMRTAGSGEYIIAEKALNMKHP